MRLIFGMLLGCVVLTLAAYVHDRLIPEGSKPVVNWDVATDLAQRSVGRVRDEIDRLISK